VQVAQNKRQAIAWQRAGRALATHRCRYEQFIAAAIRKVPRKKKGQIPVYRFATDQLHFSNSDRLIKHNALRTVAIALTVRYAVFDQSRLSSISVLENKSRAAN